MDAKLLAEIASCRKALERIADVLEHFQGDAVPAELGPAFELPVPCPHPIEYRISFSGMGDADEWECAVAKGGCGFRTPQVDDESAGVN